MPLEDCRTPQGVCGLKYICSHPVGTTKRRTPQGVCGLKSVPLKEWYTQIASHPARGVWIEITLWLSVPFVYRSHPARGVWIEIHLIAKAFYSTCCRTPQGVCGLKFSRS